MEVQIENSWKAVLQDEFSQPYFSNIVQTLRQEKSHHEIIYPPGKLIFHAFDKTPFDKVKCVILGQDPYHGPGQAHGLCFSVNDGVKPPPSLINIFKELHEDTGLPIPKSGNLEKWAENGVLLLNAILTVKAHQPASHSRIGWEQFTDTVIRKISDEKTGVVFLLWGSFARQKKTLIDTHKHFVLEAAHPSPFSASNGFFGCRHFSKTNEILQRENKKPIDWSLE